MFNRDSRNCLRFNYNMNGFHTGILRVFMDSGEGRKEKWQMKGDQKAQWTSAAVDVEMTGMRDVCNTLYRSYLNIQYVFRTVVYVEIQNFIKTGDPIIRNMWNKVLSLLCHVLQNG